MKEHGMPGAVRLAGIGLMGIFLWATVGLAAESRPTLVNGKELLRQCKADRGICHGYIAAVADVMSSVGAIHEYIACVPADVTVKQHTKAVMKWMETHPDDLNFTAHSIVAEVLSETFPCK
jgi:hypothetical protein